MKQFTIQLLIILMAIYFSACQGSKDELTITGVRFDEKALEELNLDHQTFIYNKKDLEEYKIKRLGQKIEILYYDNSIKIRINDKNKSREFVLDKKVHNGKFKGEHAEAYIHKSLFKKSLTFKVNIQEEININWVLYDKYIKERQRKDPTSFTFGLGAWSMGNRGLIITARN